MNKMILMLGILTLAGFSFALTVDPYVDSLFHRASCAQSPFFFDMRGDILDYGGSGYASQLETIQGNIGSAVSNMHDCYLDGDSVEADGPSHYDYACLNTNYALIVGYMNQLINLFLKVVVENGLPLNHLSSNISDYMQCMAGMPP